MAADAERVTAVLPRSVGPELLFSNFFLLKRPFQPQLLGVVFL